MRWLLKLANFYRDKLGMAGLVLRKTTAESQRTQRKRECQTKLVLRKSTAEVQRAQRKTTCQRKNQLGK